MRSLLTRLKRLEQVRIVEQRNGPMIVEFGYVVKRLPPDYSGPGTWSRWGNFPMVSISGRNGPACRPSARRARIA
jgi:hypothetical protein